MILNKVPISFFYDPIIVRTAYISIGPVVVETIHGFNTDISLLSLAARRTGEILVTLENQPTLYLVEPEVNGTATVIYTFEDYEVMHGIIEVAPDQFYVVCGNISLPSHQGVLGSNTVFHVNMTGFPEHVEVDEMLSFSDAPVLNGMAFSRKRRGWYTLLIVKWASSTS